MKTRPLSRSFAGGEIAEELYARLDLSKNQTGLRTCLNFWTLPHGPAQNRPGFEYVLEVSDSSKPARLIPFAYNTTQTFAIVLNNGKFRFHTQGATLLEASKNITAITQANPGVVTSNAHGYSNGETVYLAGIGGMTSLNGRFVKVAGVTANTYQLTDLGGMNINTTTYPAYTAGGTASRVYEVAHPYADADLFDIHYTQSADVLTLVHPSYAPRELRRLGATNWQLSTISFVPTVNPPAPTVVNSGAGAKIYQYKVTAVVQTGYEESIASNPATSTTSTITGVTQANPGVITTSAAHGLAIGDPIFISGVGGMTQLAGEYTVNTVPAANTLTVKTLSGGVVDTTAYSAYTAGGTIYYAGIKNDLTTAGNYNTISWTAVANAIRYNVYKFQNGLYGYIGQTSGVTFKDDNITPDISSTPPEPDNPFATDYPGAVGYFEQRRSFAGTPNKPQNFWMTRSATESNLAYSIPTRDDDRIAFRISSRDANTIRHIVPLSNLVLLTSGGEWKVAPLNSDILTPASASPKQDDAQGANNVQPIVTGKAALYAQAAGGRVRQLSYQWQAQGYVSEDISVMAPHLFDNNTIVDMAFLKAPTKMGLFVRDDGTMLGLTYLPEQQVLAWHKHTTAGLFKSIATVAEGSETALYAIAQRTVNGRSVKYVERLHSRRFATQADAFFVDSGATYTGAAATTITGLWHLIGQTVSVLADGAVVRNLTVSATGTITLPAAASKVQIGLPITADFETLPLVYENVSAFGMGMQQIVDEVYIRLKDSSGVRIGPDFGNLTLMKQRTIEPYGSPPELMSGVFQHTLSPSWGLEASVCIRQTDPLPVTISALSSSANAN